MRVDSGGLSLPLDLKAINDSHAWLCATLGLRPDHVLPSSFVARLYRHPKLEGALDAPPINSFYLDDLAKARAMLDVGTAPETLLRNLSVLKPAPAVDLLKDTAGIADLISPARFPPACWPSRGSHPVVMLQQVAVSAARTEFAGDRQGILAVNDPPAQALCWAYAWAPAVGTPVALQGKGYRIDHERDSRPNGGAYTNAPAGAVRVANGY
ncbi:MAG: hypothetical protein ACK41V_10885 [Acidovorax sp.]|uniref:hypothetical protein n=1 Tax=Acidovorax sp. TaxID=1872122 RepID=UPI00391CAF20